MQTTQTGSIVLPGQGRELPGIVFNVAAARAAGSFSIVEHPYPPGVLIPPHVHHAADQVTYVIDGEVGIRVGDDIFNAPADAYVIKPRARLIGLAAPSGLLSARGGEVDRAFEMLVRPR